MAVRTPAEPGGADEGASMDKNKTLRSGVTRRSILGGATLLVAGQVVGILPVRLAQVIRPAEAAAPVTLGNFLELSALLTGVSNLDPGVGKVYLDALQANATSRQGLIDLVRRSGVGVPHHVQTLDQLAASGVFRNKTTRTVADTITKYWFTGTYDAPGGPQAAAWTGALAWTTTYTKAMGVCGGATGYWAAKPPEK